MVIWVNNYVADNCYCAKSQCVVQRGDNKMVTGPWNQACYKFMSLSCRELKRMKSTLDSLCRHAETSDADLPKRQILCDLHGGCAFFFYK